MAKGLTIEEFWEEMQAEMKAQYGLDDDITLRRFMEHTGCTLKIAKSKLDALEKDGKVEYIGLLLDSENHRECHHWRIKTPS